MRARSLTGQVITSTAASVRACIIRAVSKRWWTATAPPFPRSGSSSTRRSWPALPAERTIVIRVLPARGASRLQLRTDQNLPLAALPFQRGRDRRRQPRVNSFQVEHQPGPRPERAEHVRELEPRRSGPRHSPAIPEHGQWPQRLQVPQLQAARGSARGRLRRHPRRLLRRAAAASGRCRRGAR